MADIDDNLSGNGQPLPKGWERKVTKRTQGKSAGKFDVYIISPEGKRFRSRTELNQHITKNNLNLSIDDFNFTVSNLKSDSQIAKAEQSSKEKGGGAKMNLKKKDENEEVEDKDETNIDDNQEKGEISPKRTLRNKSVLLNQENKNSNKTSKTKNKEDLEDEVKPEKRGRRAAKKDAVVPVKKSQKSETEETEDNKSENQEETTRGRGRPRKVQEEKKQEEKPVEGRGRGRPKKAAEKPVKEETSNLKSSDKKPKSEQKNKTPETKKEDDPFAGLKFEELPIRSARLKALKKDEETKPEVETPSRNRGRPKKESEPVKNEKKSTVQKKSGPVKNKAKNKSKKKKETDPDNPDEVKNAQILAEIDAELAEIYGTKRRRSPTKRKTNPTASSVTVTPAKVQKEDKDRPALEGFQPQPSSKRRRSDSKGTETEVTPAMQAVEGTRTSSRRRRTTAKAAESYEQDESQESDSGLASSSANSKSAKKSKKTKVEEKKVGKNKRGNRSRVTEDTDEGESIPLDSLEGAINSASSLLDGSSDSSHEGETHETEVVVTKQSRSGRNVRSPRRPMEGDFETDFSVLRKAMNATTATSDIASRKRRNSSSLMSPHHHHHQVQSRLPVLVDYDLGFENRGDTARTRTFDENIKEKTIGFMDNSGAAESNYLNMDFIAPPPSKSSAHRKQRRSSSTTELKPEHEKSMFRKQKAATKHGGGRKDRSLLHSKVSMSEGDVLDFPALGAGPKMSRDLLEFEMTPPPTNPIIPSDDHSYSLSSRYYADQTAAPNPIDIPNEDDIEAGEGTSSVAVETLPLHMAGGSGGDGDPPSSPGGASSPPKQIVIYVGDKPTVVPVMQDESGMSVITLPNGLAEDE